jgi:hypothetical protein
VRATDERDVSAFEGDRSAHGRFSRRDIFPLDEDCVPAEWHGLRQFLHMQECAWRRERQ